MLTVCRYRRWNAELVTWSQSLLGNENVNKIKDISNLGWPFYDWQID